MFEEEINLFAEGALKKDKLLKNNFLGFFVLSLLGGVFIGLATVLVLVIGSYLHNFQGYKILMGLSFAGGLSLVYFAGAELFTGNTFTVAIGVAKKRITLMKAIKICFICYIGNFLGSFIFSVLLYFANYLKGDLAQYLSYYAEAKITLAPMELLIKAIFCNFLVCAATWCNYKCKSESGRLILIFWCIFMFVTIGFEHSVANMTTFSMAILASNNVMETLKGSIYNLSIVTLGNIIGGVFFLAVPYLIVSRKID